MLLEGKLGYGEELTLAETLSFMEPSYLIFAQTSSLQGAAEKLPKVMHAKSERVRLNLLAIYSGPTKQGNFFLAKDPKASLQKEQKKKESYAYA